MKIHYGENKAYAYRYIENRDYDAIEDSFLKSTLQALDYLYQNDILTITYHKNTPEERTLDIIDVLLYEAPETIHIREGKKNRYFPENNTIWFKYRYGVKFRKNYKKPFRGENIGYNSPLALLAHEIIHCYHDLFDDKGYRKRRINHSMKGKKISQQGIDLSFPNQEEELVVHLTNQVVKRLGEDKRTNYGRNYYKVTHVLSTKECREKTV